MIKSLRNIPEANGESKLSSQSISRDDNQEMCEAVFSLAKIMTQKMTLNYIEETEKSYLLRGGLNSDNLIQLMNSSPDWKYNLSQRDQMLMDLLGREVVDLREGEIQNMAIYIIRKKQKNDLEINFLCNLLKNLSFFSSNDAVRSEIKEFSSLKQIMKAVELKSYKRHEIIFNHGEKGNEFFTVLKGSALCLVLDPNYKKPIEKEIKQLIQEQQGESKAQIKAINFINSVAEGLNKKISVESKVKKFVGNLKSKFQKTHCLKKTSTQEIEGMLGIGSNQNNVQSDSEFIKINFPGFMLVKTFMPGESFGEIALITSQGRTATLVSRENSQYMVLRKEGFDKSMNLMKKNVLREKIEFMRGFEFFSNLSTRKILQVIQQANLINCTAKQNIYEEGDNSNFIFLIFEGEVELKSRYAHSEELIQHLEIGNEQKINDLKDLEQLRMRRNKLDVKKMVTIAILGKGGFFGEEEIVKGMDQRQSTAIAHSQNTQIYVLEKARLLMTVGANIFERCKKSISIKDEIKDERIKNVFKMMIPQKDISNLSFYLEQEKITKEKDENKQKLKLMLAKRMKTNFVNRFVPEHKIDSIGAEDITDNDILEYNDAQELQSSKAIFSKIQQIKLTSTDTSSSSTNLKKIVNPAFSSKENRRSFKVLPVNILSDIKVTEQQKSRSTSVNKNEIVKLRSLKQIPLSQDNDEYLNLNGQSFQSRPYLSLVEIDDKTLKSNQKSKYTSKQEEELNHNTSLQYLQEESKIPPYQQEEQINFYENGVESKRKKFALHLNNSIQKISSKGKLFLSPSCKNTLHPNFIISDSFSIQSNFSQHVGVSQSQNFLQLPSSLQNKSFMSSAHSLRQIPSIINEKDQKFNELKKSESEFEQLSYFLETHQTKDELYSSKDGSAKGRYSQRNERKQMNEMKLKLENTLEIKPMQKQQNDNILINGGIHRNRQLNYSIKNARSPTNNKDFSLNKKSSKSVNHFNADLSQSSFFQNNISPSLQANLPPEQESMEDLLNQNNFKINRGINMPRSQSFKTINNRYSSELKLKRQKDQLKDIAPHEVRQQPINSQIHKSSSFKALFSHFEPRIQNKNNKDYQLKSIENASLSQYLKKRVQIKQNTDFNHSVELSKPNNSVKSIFRFKKTLGSTYQDAQNSLSTVSFDLK